MNSLKHFTESRRGITGWHLLLVLVSFVVRVTSVDGAANESIDDREKSKANNKPIHVVIAFGPGKGELTEFARHLKKTYGMKVSLVEAAKAKKTKNARKETNTYEPTPFSNIQAFADADVIVSNLYRTWAPPDQLKQIKQHFKSKPVVGLRKAHHAFQNWLGADREVFGVSYKGHYYGNNVTIRIVDKHAQHPLMRNVHAFLPEGGLYKHVDPEKNVESLMIGGPSDEEPMPQCWTRIVKDRDNQRVFYTRYDPKDLKDAGVRDLVVRAIQWAAAQGTTVSGQHGIRRRDQ